MASDEIYEFTITTPAGTLPAAPLVTPTVIPSRVVEHIQWRVPPGALGVMGWRISMRNVAIIPRNAGAWIVAHQESGGWDMHRQPDSGDWSVTTYNTGSNPHALYVTFYAQVRPPAVHELVLASNVELSGMVPPDWTGT